MKKFYWLRWKDTGEWVVGLEAEQLYNYGVRFYLHGDDSMIMDDEIDKVEVGPQILPPMSEATC